MSEKDQDKLVKEGLKAVQQHEREARARGEKFNLMVMMRRAMGYPSDLTAGSIGGSLLEAVQTAFGKHVWDVVYNTAEVQEHHRQHIPDDYPLAPQGAVLLMIYAMELGREIGKRER